MKANNKNKSVPDLSNPYGAVYRIDALEAEAKRLGALPHAEFNWEIIKRWRTRQIWLISQRINDIRMPPSIRQFKQL